MAIYDVLKDVWDIAQKTNNIELYTKLAEVNKMVISLQDENARLQKENSELSEAQNIEDDIQRYDQPYFTLGRDGNHSKRYYCATCWGKDKKLIQMSYMGGAKRLQCNSCGAKFFLEPENEGPRIGY